MNQNQNTPEQMPAGRIMDGRIAELMGWKWLTWNQSISILFPPHWYEGQVGRYGWATGLNAEPDYDSERFYDSSKGGKTMPVVPAYSTDIAAAWQVVEKLAGDFALVKLDGGGYEAKAYAYGEPLFEPVAAETAPLAICRAALLTVNRLAVEGKGGQGDA